jgi:hypothetical protein
MAVWLRLFTISEKEAALACHAYANGRMPKRRRSQEDGSDKWEQRA